MLGCEITKFSNAKKTAARRIFYDVLRHNQIKNILMTSRNDHKPAVRHTCGRCAVIVQGNKEKFVGCIRNA